MAFLYLKGPSDARAVSTVIAAGASKIFKVIWKAFPGNQSRAESMAIKLACSTYPVTRQDYDVGSRILVRVRVRLR